MIGYRFMLFHSSAAIPLTGDLSFAELKPGSWAAMFAGIDLCHDRCSHN